MPSFLEERKDYLLRFEYLLGRAQSASGLRGFDRDELYELGRLYRKLSGDLAKAQTIGADNDTLAYLNNMLAQGHNIVYRGESNPLRSFIFFITTGFPRLFRKHFGVIFISTLVLFLPAIWAYYLYLGAPQWREVILPASVQEAFETSLEEEGPSMLAAAIEEEDMALASTYIIMNNIQVCMYVFGGGMLFGLGSIILLFKNGLILGGIAAIFVSRGAEYSLYFFSGLLPHGVLELPAIAISGGAGLLLGKAILVPGRLKRSDALKKNGRQAAGLILGVALTLCAAGIIEGFITPIKIGGTANVPSLMYAKLGFSILLFLLFIAYLMLAGRRPGEEAFDFVRDEISNVKKYSPKGLYRILRSEDPDA